MTDLQRTEFDILKSFVDVCDALGLRYYLVCGSALGAVKYRGFIPWDDDVDVALPRPDYDVFCARAPALLPEHLFLQTYETDPEYPNIFAKLRNSETTYLESSVLERRMNHGVYIDVFPLDGYPKGRFAAARLELCKKLRMLQLSCAFSSPASRKIAWLLRLERLVGLHKRTARTARRLVRVLSGYPAADAALWCNHGNWQGKQEYAPRAQYGDGCWAEFEGLRVRIPEQYDAYLTQKYGDWRADLPEADKRGHHTAQIVDLERSYRAYAAR